MTQTLKVAVIGLGNIGKVVATNLAKSNRSFIATDRSIDKAKELSQDWTSAQPADIDTAVKEADIFVLAIPFPAIAEFFAHYSSKLEGKIIVDPSNPIAPAETGVLKRLLVKQNQPVRSMPLHFLQAQSLPKHWVHCAQHH